MPALTGRPRNHTPPFTHLLGLTARCLLASTECPTGGYGLIKDCNIPFDHLLTPPPCTSATNV
jgi:hypothetical protein